MTEQQKRRSRPIQQKFILHWGEMGTRWGINRTVAQIHALLYPVAAAAQRRGDRRRRSTWPAPTSATACGSCRAGASSGSTHVLGDRRDHFESMKDVWEMFRIIVDERKKREADPTLSMLREAVAEAKKPGAADAYTRERLADMLQFFELMTSWASRRASCRRRRSSAW